MEKLIYHIKEALQLPNAEITNICLAGGMTNLNYLVTIDSTQYIVRVPGNGTQAIINRKKEKDNLELASKIGINPELRYFNIETGLKITRKVENATTVTPEIAKREKTLGKVAEVFKALHFCREEMSNDFKLFELIRLYEQLALQAGAKFYEGFVEVKEVTVSLQQCYEALNIRVVPCHIDPACSNFIFNEEGDFYLIDWEYSGMFDSMWDLAAYSLEAVLSQGEEAHFLNVYFQREASVQEQERILLHKIFQDVLWSIWTLYKEAKGDDFGMYGKKRFERARNNIQLYKEIFEQNKVG